jgi:LysM repeat protein
MSPKYNTAQTRANKPSRNAVLAKKNAILLLTLVSSLLLLVIKLIGAILWVVKFVATWIIKIGVRLFGLPLYQRLKTIQTKTTNANLYIREQFGNNFGRSVIIYGGLITLSLFVTTSNIKAREIRPEEVGRNSSLYTLLVAQTDSELLTEVSVEIDDDEATIFDAPERALANIGVESTIEPTGQQILEIDNTLITSQGDALIRPDLPATDITPKPRDSIITYIVQDSDTISQIAENFNLSTNTLLWENRIGPRDFIKPGQELVILPVTGVTHTIKRGDTLNAIASRYKSKAEDILEVNKLADASELKIGAKVVVPDGIPPPSARPILSRSGLADLRSIFKPATPIAGKLNWPTTRQRITQYFRGWRHTGLDIGAPIGQPIYASNDGIVITSGWNSKGYGLYVIIDHGNGFHTLYAHNSQNLVKKGVRVKKGDIIAAVGSTGRSTGPHVHYEVRVNGTRVNPLDYL